MGNLSRSIEALRTNHAQWQAFNLRGHRVVLAPPGSGKTQLLATCVAFDLYNRIAAPRGAACVTLTNAAADELRRRLDKLGAPLRSSLFVGTVHSFALSRIIGPFAALVGRPELAKASIASKEQMAEAYDQAIDSVFGPTVNRKNARDLIKFHRRRLSDEHTWLQAGEPYLAAARRYDALLRVDGLIDFDGAVAAAVELVEQHAVVRRVVAARYPGLYVDEYQDLAPGLDRLVRALCFGHDTDVELFAVGDPEQAIFGWTGTRPELLAELAELPGVGVVHLKRNYRCGQEIIRLANLIQRRGRTVVGERAGGEVSPVWCPGGFADQCEQAAKAVGLARNRGLLLHEIAVICPQNDHCQLAAKVLRQLGFAASVREAEYPVAPVTSFVEACAAWAMLGRELSSYRLGSIHRSWRRLLGPMWSRDRDVHLTELLLSYPDRPGTFASRLLADLLGAGLRRAVVRPSQSDDADALAEMQHALEVGALRDLDVGGLAERARKIDCVNVTTMSSSKGLEFDTVLILGADEEMVPHYKSLNDPARIDEDRRKFYVSVTRARSTVKIFYSGWVTTFNGRQKTTAPSRFLYDMGLLQR